MDIFSIWQWLHICRGGMKFETGNGFVKDLGLKFFSGCGCRFGIIHAKPSLIPILYYPLPQLLL